MIESWLVWKHVCAGSINITNAFSRYLFGGKQISWQLL